MKLLNFFFILRVGDIEKSPLGIKGTFVLFLCLVFVNNAPRLREYHYSCCHTMQLSFPVYLSGALTILPQSLKSPCSPLDHQYLPDPC